MRNNNKETIVMEFSEIEFCENDKLWEQNDKLWEDQKFYFVLPSLSSL